MLDEIGDKAWYRGVGGLELIEVNDEYTRGDLVTIKHCDAETTQEITDVHHGGKGSVTLTLERRKMFEIGDKVWYRPDYGRGAPSPATVTRIVSDQEGPFAPLHCRKDGAQFDSWGYEYQFTSRACHLCGEPTAEPGCPLCPDCAEGQEKREQDAKLEREQRRRPR